MAYDGVGDVSQNNEDTMRTTKKTLICAVAATLTLGACAEQSRFGPGGDLQRTGQGALAGALAGGAIGALTEGESSERRNAAIGAVIGAGVGAAIGNQLDRQAAELRDDFSSGAIDVVNTGDRLIVRMPQDILFATDSATVAPTLRSDLGVLAQNLQRYPNSVVRVVGHTDNTGSAAYNQQLSERRAQAVTNILATNGVSGRRLAAIGAGENEPIASNLTAEGRQLNRRVEIIIVPTR